MKINILSCKSLFLTSILIVMVSHNALSGRMMISGTEGRICAYSMDKGTNGFTFTTSSPVKALCAGGTAFIEITASGGTLPYEYYVIPEEQWEAGDRMYDMLYNNNFSRLYRYTYAQNIIPVTAGTTASPRRYWVAVQDAAENGVISGTNLLSWWKRVSVTSNEGFVVTPTANMDLMTNCPGSADGRIGFTISGATRFKNGYKIYRDGLFIKLGTNYETDANLLAGKYEFSLVDSLNCSYTVTYEVKSPKPIIFNIGHVDAGCGSATNELWISSVDASTGSGPISSWRWRHTTDPNWATGSSWYSLTTKVTDLPSDYYYVEIKDGNDCTKVWTDASGNGEIPVGLVRFRPVWKGLGYDLMTIYVVRAQKDGEDLVICDEVAVYDGRLCVGTVKLDETPVQGRSSSYGVIKASRAEFGQRNGFTPEHEIIFKMWDKSKLREVVVKDVQFVNPIGWREVRSEPFNPNEIAYVRLYWTNGAPVANAGPDQTVSEGDVVTLDGTASSDEDQDVLSYMWTAAAGITLSSDMISKPVFTAPQVAQDTPFRFMLMVNDGVLNSAQPDTVWINVRNSSSSIQTGPKYDRVVKFYPNPTTGMLYISTEEKSLAGCTAQVFNSLGQVILNRMIDSDPFEIAITGHANGWYFVKITGNSWTTSKKILLKPIASD